MNESRVRYTRRGDLPTGEPRERANEWTSDSRTHTHVSIYASSLLLSAISLFLPFFVRAWAIRWLPPLWISRVSRTRRGKEASPLSRARAFVVVGVYAYIVDVERVSLYTTQLCAPVCVSTLLSRLFIRYSCAAVANGSSSRIFRSSFYFSLPLSKVTRRGIAIRCSYVQFCRRTYVRVCVSMGFAFF